jgi:hypothetical protein
MRNLMFDDAQTIMNNLHYLPDITHDELLTAVIGLCEEVIELKKEIEGLKNGS